MERLYASEPPPGSASHHQLGHLREVFYLFFIFLFFFTSEKCPDADLKEVRSRRAEELLDVVETLALGLGDEEEAEEEGEDSDAPEHPERACLGQTNLLERMIADDDIHHITDSDDISYFRNQISEWSALFAQLCK